MLNPQLARNFRLNIAEGVAYNAGNAFLSTTAILPLFVAHYTDARWMLGLIPAIAFLADTLTQPLGAYVTARSRDFWWTYRLQALLPRLCLLPLCLVPLLPGSLALWGFFASFALYMLAMGFNTPAWYEYVGQLIPAALRGRFLGYRSAFGGAASLAAMGLASWLLSGLPQPWNFTACFALAAVLLFAGFGCVARTRHDWQPHQQRRTAAPLRATALAMLREPGTFRRYLLCRMVVSGSVMGSAFYVVHAQQAFGLSAGKSSLLAIALVTLPSITCAYWGRLSDAVGNKRLVVPAALAAGLANALMLAVPALPVYVAALFVIGCANVLVAIADNRWLLEVEPQRSGAAVSVFNLAMMLPGTLFALGAGVVAQGLGTAWVFLFTALAWLVGGSLLAGSLPEEALAQTRAA